MFWLRKGIHNKWKAKETPHGPYRTEASQMFWLWQSIHSNYASKDTSDDTHSTNPLQMLELQGMSGIDQIHQISHTQIISLL